MYKCGEALASPSEPPLNDSFHGSLSRVLTNFKVVLHVNNLLIHCVWPLLLSLTTHYHEP